MPLNIQTTTTTVTASGLTIPGATNTVNSIIIEENEVNAIVEQPSSTNIKTTDKEEHDEIDILPELNKNDDNFKNNRKILRMISLPARVFNERNSQTMNNNNSNKKTIKFNDDDIFINDNVYGDFKNDNFTFNNDKQMKRSKSLENMADINKNYDENSYKGKLNVYIVYVYVYE